MDKNNSLTTGSLWKGIFIFSLPLIFSNLLQVLFNMTDVAVIGRFSGPKSLGALGSTTMLVTLFTGVLIGVCNGVNVFVARYIGAKDNKRLTRCVQTSFLVCLIIGILVLLLGQFLAKPILCLLNTKEELIDLASLYIKVYFFGMPALALYNYGNSIYSAAGNTKRPLIFLSIAGVINIFLNLLFVIAFKMDVKGVALASAISQYISAILIVTSLLLTKNEYRLTFKDYKVSFDMVKNILYIGIPSAIQYSIFSIANLFIQSAVNSLDTIYVEANSVAANADTLVWEVMAAFYLACSSFMSQNYGAGNKKRVKDTYIITTIYSVGTGLVLGGLILALGHQFLYIFTNDKDVVNAGYKRLVIMALSYFLSGFMDNTTAASRGLGKTIVPTIIVVLGSCVFRIVWIYTIFNSFKTITSLYLLYSVSWTITSIAEIIYFIPMYRRQLKNI